MGDPLATLGHITSREDGGKDLGAHHDPASSVRPSPSSSSFPPSTILEDETPQGPFALVYSVDSFGQPELRFGGAGEVLRPVDVEAAEEEEEGAGGREGARESARAELKKSRDEDEHLNWTDGDGMPHTLYSDDRGDLCYLDDTTHRMLFLPDEVVFRSDPILSKPEMAQLHMGFLEVSITSLLYHRQIYPPNLFEPAHKWGTPCWSSKTLSLASFVGGLVDTLAEDFAEGRTRRIAISLRNSADSVLERFVLEFSEDSTKRPPSLREFESDLRASLAFLDATAGALPSLDFKGQGRFSVLGTDRPEDANPISQQQSNSTNESSKTSRSSGKSVELTRRTLVRRTTMLHWNMAIFLEQST